MIQIKLGSVDRTAPRENMLTKAAAVSSPHRLHVRPKVFLVIGLSVKLRQFGDTVHLADEIVPTYVGILTSALIYCERRTKIWGMWSSIYVRFASFSILKPVYTSARDMASAFGGHAMHHCPVKFSSNAASHLYPNVSRANALIAIVATAEGRCDPFFRQMGKPQA